MTLSPGTYLRLRREAADLTVEDAAMLLPTEPHVDVLARAAWLRRIEADEEPISLSVVSALRYAFAFDPEVLMELDYARQNPGKTRPPRICRRCGCSDRDACDPTCWWAGPDLCSACPSDVPDQAAQKAAA